MTTARFIHTEVPQNHPGIARVENAVQTVRGLRSRFDSARGLAAMLLAALVAALLVVADQVIDTWAEGHLLAAWILLWVVGFAAIGLFAGTARSLSGRAVRALDAWAARRAQARADERLWAIACSDARVMADLKAAMAREDETIGTQDDAATSDAARRAMRLARRRLGGLC